MTDRTARIGQWREADLRRAIKVAKASGLGIRGVEVTPDGTVRVLTGAPIAQGDPNPWDEILPGFAHLAKGAAEEADADAELERRRAGRTRARARARARAQQLAEAKEMLKSAASKLDRKTLAQLYEGHRTRSVITIARALGVSKHKLELAAQQAC